MPSFHHRARYVPSGLAQISIAGVLWGTAPIAFDTIHVRTSLTSMATSAHRLLIAALVLIVVTASLGSLRSFARAARTHPLRIAMIGAGVAGYQALWFASITYVGASIATVLSLGSAPVLVTIWENGCARTRPSTGQSLVVVAALSGLVLASSPAGDLSSTSGSRTLGLVMAAGSGVLYAVTTVLTRRVANEVTPLTLTTATTAIGAALLLPVSALAGPVATSDPASVLALAYLGVVTMAMGYLLLYSGLRTAPASAATVATLIEPATATVLAVLVLGDRLTAPATAGVVLILVSVGALPLVKRQLSNRVTAKRLAARDPADGGRPEFATDCCRLWRAGCAGRLPKDVLRNVSFGYTVACVTANRKTRDGVRRVSTLTELKALSHPTRLRLFYALKAHDSLTATQLGEMVDESPASVSYHLNQLAASGFVEETDNASGDGRQRWWRAAAHGVSWFPTDFSDSPDGATVAEAAKAVVLEHQWSRLVEYGRTATSWGHDWTDAAFSADNVLRLTPSQTDALGVELLEVIERHRSIAANEESHDAAVVMVLLHGFPTQM